METTTRTATPWEVIPAHGGGYHIARYWGAEQAVELARAANGHRNFRRFALAASAQQAADKLNKAA